MDINKNELFYQDNKLFEFDAIVTDCVALDKGYGIYFERTGFFPEAGGQKADNGMIDGNNVFDVQVTANGIMHIIDKPIVVGLTVHCVLDKAERIRKERNHTGEHIVSSVVHRQFGYSNVGFHMGEYGMDVDFDGPFTKDDLIAIEKEANMIVMENVPVKTYFPDESELQGINYRSKLELSSPRIVEIEGYDYCACCAPHVSFTGEVGLIKIVDCYRNRGNSRLTLLCQNEALEYVQSVCRDAEISGSLLSVKPYAVSTAVNKQLEHNSDIGRENAELKRMVTKSIVDSLIPTDGKLLVFCPSFASKDVLNSALDISKVACVFSEANGGYSYKIASKSEDVRELAKSLNIAFNGKGGGRAELVQGQLVADRIQIESFFNKEE